VQALVICVEHLTYSPKHLKVTATAIRECHSIPHASHAGYDLSSLHSSGCKGDMHLILHGNEATAINYTKTLYSFVS
jgi:hypothetical protein